MEVNKKFLEAYNNKYVRSLIQLVPFGIGSSIDTYLTEVIKEAGNKRMKLFFGNLDNDNIAISKTLMENEDFLYCFFKTTDYVVRTRRKEKIIFFSKLFGNLCHENINFDAYELKCNILDELEYQEIKILFELKNLEDGTLDELIQNNFMTESNKDRWRGFLFYLSKKLEIEVKELAPMVSRLQRTGCVHLWYNINSSIDLDNGQKVRTNPARTTPLFNSLYSLIFKK